MKESRLKCIETNLIHRAHHHMIILLLLVAHMEVVAARGMEGMARIKKVLES